MAVSAENGGGWRGSRWRIATWGTAALVLLLPLATNAPWSAFDYAFMGALLGAAGLGFELAVRRTGDAAYRAASGVALAATFLLVWINAAVGIIGSEQEDANLLYGAVLATGLLGAVGGRFRPAGMARAMAATAVAQALVPVIASVSGLGSPALVWSLEVLGLTGFFAVLWLLSAWLFGKAAA